MVFLWLFHDVRVHLGGLPFVCFLRAGFNFYFFDLFTKKHLSMPCKRKLLSIAMLVKDKVQQLTTRGWQRASNGCCSRQLLYKVTVWLDKNLLECLLECNHTDKDVNHNNRKKILLTVRGCCRRRRRFVAHCSGH